MSIQNYSGRSVDILAYSGGRPNGKVLLLPELAQEEASGEICTGIQKLAQRFLLELLTERGTMVYLPARGCEFMQDARLGRWQTSLDVMASFSASLLDIKENLITEESGDDPDDERFADAELVAVSLSLGTASVTIRVSSQAGTSRMFIAPLSVTV
jgi:hypothetical protein